MRCHVLVQRFATEDANVESLLAHCGGNARRSRNGRFPSNSRIAEVSPAVSSAGNSRAASAWGGKISRVPPTLVARLQRQPQPLRATRGQAALAGPDGPITLARSATTRCRCGGRESVHVQGDSSRRDDAAHFHTVRDSSFSEFLSPTMRKWAVGYRSAITPAAGSRMSCPLRKPICPMVPINWASAGRPSSRWR